MLGHLFFVSLKRIIVVQSRKKLGMVILPRSCYLIVIFFKSIIIAAGREMKLWEYEIAYSILFRRNCNDKTNKK